MRYRHTTAVATAVAGALVLAACGGGNGNGNGGGESGEAGGNGEPASLDALTIMAPFFSPTAPEPGGEIEEALSDLAGVDLNMRWVPNSNYGDQTNVVLASDDIPDVMVIQDKSQGFIQTAEAGGFWELTDYLASGDFPNLVTENPEVQEASGVNGQVYGIYRARDVIRHSIILRADWMENLGLEDPETLDDLAEIARAFTEDDPDGNGADDTYGLIVPEWPAAVGTGSPWDAIDIWHGSGNVWRDDGGELTATWTTDEWRDSLRFQRDLIDSGYVNPDFATMPPEDWNQRFMNGDGGIIIDVQSRAAELINLYRQNDPDDFDSYVRLVGQVEGPNGKFSLPTAGYAGFLAVPRSSIETEEELLAVLQVLNDLNSPEAQILMNNGMEGHNFEVQDGFAVNDPEMQEFTDFVTGAWAQLGMNVAGYHAYSPLPQTDYDVEILELREELQERDLQDAVFNPALGLISETYVTNATQLDTLIADARIQYLAGQIDEAGMDEAVERWRSSGGDQVDTEVNELYSHTG